MVEVAKEIWSYHLLIKITAGYLPSDFNIAADRESWNVADSSQWMLSHQFFQRVCLLRDLRRRICLCFVYHSRFQRKLHGNQILRVMQQTNFKRIGHKNSFNASVLKIAEIWSIRLRKRSNTQGNNRWSTENKIGEVCSIQWNFRGFQFL